jgi:hypothetical protein
VNAFIRWSKFNLVGVVGMVVQLAALALFNRSTPIPKMLYVDENPATPLS